MSFCPDVVRLYVAHGFRPSPEGVRLKCDPEHEARTFDMGGSHGTFAALGEIATPVTVMAGNADAGGPGTIAGPVADALPNATLVQREDWDHFTPFVDPSAMAAAIRDVL
jgi:pimeloyl-ACP methyl ester carboxylesterase